MQNHIGEKETILKGARLTFQIDKNGKSAKVCYSNHRSNAVQVYRALQKACANLELNRLKITKSGQDISLKPEQSGNSINKEDIEKLETYITNSRTREREVGPFTTEQNKDVELLKRLDKGYTDELAKKLIKRKSYKNSFNTLYQLHNSLKPFFSCEQLIMVAARSASGKSLEALFMTWRGLELWFSRKEIINIGKHSDGKENLEYASELTSPLVSAGFLAEQVYKMVNRDGGWRNLLAVYIILQHLHPLSLIDRAQIVTDLSRPHGVKDLAKKLPKEIAVLLPIKRKEIALDVAIDAEESVKRRKVDHTISQAIFSKTPVHTFFYGSDKANERRCIIAGKVPFGNINVPSHTTDPLASVAISSFHTP
jgi:hypothetical protein